MTKQFESYIIKCEIVCKGVNYSCIYIQLIKMKKVLTSILVILIILGVLIGVALLFYFSKLNKIDYVEIAEEEIEVSAGVEEQLSGYRNIVLFGLDNSSESYEGRSDCIIIFSLNQETNDVKMTSIYRDTYVKVDGHGYTKINHAYAYGGAPLAMSTINKNLDLDIKEFVTINFDVVKDVVDSVGGIKLNITSAEATQIPGISKAGTYTLNGKQALAYGRIRKIDSDYKRAERMRTVIDAVFQKVKKMSLTEMNALVDKILPEVKTNIKASEITSMLTKVTAFNIKESIGWPYEVSGKIIDGTWYGVPRTLKSCVQKLHKELFNEEDYQTTETVNNISATISKRTGVK